MFLQLKFSSLCTRVCFYLGRKGRAGDRTPRATFARSLVFASPSTPLCGCGSLCSHPIGTELISGAHGKLFVILHRHTLTTKRLTGVTTFSSQDHTHTHTQHHWVDPALSCPKEFSEGSQGVAVTSFINSLLSLSTLNTQELHFPLSIHPGASKSLKMGGYSFVWS